MLVPTITVICRILSRMKFSIYYYFRWKLLKNSLDFIKKSKKLAFTLDENKNDLFHIINEEIRKEIIKTQGSEFDLYLKGLFFRDFSIESILF